MDRLVSIRRLSAKGSTAVDHVLVEAEQIIRDAQARGAIAVDTDTNETITEIGPLTENVIIVDPIQGGK